MTVDEIVHVHCIYFMCIPIYTDHIGIKKKHRKKEQEKKTEMRELAIAGMTFPSVLINRRNFFISLWLSAATRGPRSRAAEGRSANRALVEISPVMPRFNVVIPRLRRGIMICRRAIVQYRTRLIMKHREMLEILVIPCCCVAVEICTFDRTFPHV